MTPPLLVSFHPCTCFSMHTLHAMANNCSPAAADVSHAALVDKSANGEPEGGDQVDQTIGEAANGNGHADSASCHSASTVYLYTSHVQPS